VKAVDAWDWDSDKNLKFKVLEEEHDEECDEWNAESTLKLKEVVVSAREQFKWQTAGADDSLKSKSFGAWLKPRNLAFRPLYVLQELSGMFMWYKIVRHSYVA